jgi:uncharacterized protein YndB with AHSA1/START domain
MSDQTFQSDRTTDRRDRLGEILHDGDRVGLRFERRLGHAPERVWRALTASEDLRHWFPADIVGERRAGAPLRLRFWPESVEQAAAEMEQVGVDPLDPELPGELLVWDPPRVFELMWDTDRLRWELEPDGAGTRLVFVTWLLGEQGPRGTAGTAAGYHACLDQLEELLATGTSRTVDRAEIEALERAYAALGAG